MDASGIIPVAFMNHTVFGVRLSIVHHARNGAMVHAINSTTVSVMPGNNKVRQRSRSLHQLRFTGVDGEGVNYLDSSGATYECNADMYCKDYRENEIHEHTVALHKYVLLSVGDRSYHRNGEELQFDEIMEFLWDCFEEDPHAVFVGFYLTYDFTCWLKSLPEERARRLLSDEGVASRRRKIGRNPIPFPVNYGDWEFDMHAGKRFKLRRVGAKQWMYINDVGPFFQQSFTSVIESWPETIYTPEEQQIVEIGKARRADAKLDQDMIRYNVTENAGLSRIMGTLNEGFVAMDVRLKRNQWYGPGQAAQQWLNNIKAPSRDDAKNIPEPVLIAGQAAYYGGWFEIMAHGHIPGTTYEYDINSAYPAAIAGLPCFDHGEWLHNEPNSYEHANESKTWVLVRASIEGSDPYIGAGPHRCRDGTILRPHRTGGWYWATELHASTRAGTIDRIEVLETWTWKQTCNHTPFNAIADLYTQRFKVGKNTPLGRALKLVYNSAYGKLAQSVGEPRYANPLYASLITSACRTRIWEAIGTHPLGTSGVVMVATDGVFFRTSHPSLPLSSKLGEWDSTEHENLTLFMPGLYWSDATRNRTDGKIKSRGISASDLRLVVGRLDEKWNLHHARVSLGLTRMQTSTRVRRAVGIALSGENAGRAIVEGWPIIAVPIKFGMVSAKLALHRNAWATCGHVPMGLSRILSGDPSDKRHAATRYISEGICRTRPYTVAPDGSTVSTPYEKRFGLELRDKQTADDIVCDTGQVNDVLYEWMRP